MPLNTDLSFRSLLSDASDEASTLVLASGGLDSSALLAFAKQQSLNPIAFHIDYGQPSSMAECRAVTRITEELTIPLLAVRYCGSQLSQGEILGRNAFLLHTALLEFPSRSGLIMLAIHSGTDYADCSPEFVDLMQRSFDLHTGGAIDLAAPFVCWTKEQIANFAHDLGIVIDHTYSCEAANIPCGECLSCIDRKLLTAGRITL